MSKTSMCIKGKYTRDVLWLGMRCNKARAFRSVTWEEEKRLRVRGAKALSLAVQ